MNFVLSSFRLCKELLDEEMYNILNEPRYSEIKMLSSEEFHEWMSLCKWRHVIKKNKLISMFISI
jgi:hypothetical protein